MLARQCRKEKKRKKCGLPETEVVFHLHGEKTSLLASVEEVWKSFTDTKCVDVWLKNDSEKRSVISLRGFHMVAELS